MDVVFTAHNIRLDDGTTTKPDSSVLLEDSGWFLAARRVLSTVFPGDRRHVRLADLGCLEGGYAVGFARMGFQVLGVEVRSSNIAACRHVQASTRLPNLEFVQDDVWNIKKHGSFDAVFCCGLFYHLDRPKQFLDTLAAVTSKLLILQTHFATDKPCESFSLSELTENDSLTGRWYTEFTNDHEHQNREQARWSSWDNRRSFWVKREHLLQAMHDVGFDLVAEQFDGLGHDIVGSMTKGNYGSELRGTFTGIKSELAPGNEAAARHMAAAPQHGRLPAREPQAQRVNVARVDSTSAQGVRRPPRWLTRAAKILREQGVRALATTVARKVHTAAMGLGRTR